ncbi:hypothetical protein BdWA1_003205 [Babesia duncani]|uniref:RAP domain-containing protein n=1 Tax=Babesia duncani TaxID=323732 RepID=A0AAD9PIW5_9APIC|nr:hypothetical protein BdWA1_003205 [Babesia duncani]
MQYFLIWLSLVHGIGAYVCSNGYSRLLPGFTRPFAVTRVSKDPESARVHSFTFGEKPLLFTPNTTRGKEHEIVLSESNLFGLNKILHDAKRRREASKPLYPVGTHVYVKGNVYTCCRATVLDNRLDKIGDPYQVLVALDCRDSRGLVAAHLAQYHGTSVWVPESNLCDEIIYAPLTAPDLSNPVNNKPFEKTRRAGIDVTSIYYSQIIATTNVYTLSRLYNEIKQQNINLGNLPLITYIQMVRALKRGQFKAMECKMCSEIHKDVLEALQGNDSSNVQLETLVWATWALANMKFMNFACEYALEALEILLTRLLQVVDFKKVPNHYIRLVSIAVYRLQASNAFSDICKELIYKMGSLICARGFNEFEPRILVAVALAFGNFLEYKEFTNGLCSWILDNSTRISYRDAVDLLVALKRMKHDDLKIVDALQAIIYADEGFGKWHIRIGGKTVNKLIRCFKGNSQALHNLLNVLVIQDSQFSPETIIRVLHNLRKIEYGRKFVEFITRKGACILSKFSLVQLCKFLIGCSNCKQLPPNMALDWLMQMQEKIKQKMDSSGNGNEFSIPMALPDAIFTFVHKHRHIPGYRQLWEYGQESLQAMLSQRQNSTFTSKSLNILTRILNYWSITGRNYTRADAIVLLVSKILEKFAKCASKSQTALLLDITWRVSPETFARAAEIVKGEGLDTLDESIKPMAELLLGMKRHLYFAHGKVLSIPNGLDPVEIGGPDALENVNLHFNLHWPIAFLLVLANANLINPEIYNDLVCIESTKARGG